jgi:hypothetical protein
MLGNVAGRGGAPPRNRGGTVGKVHELFAVTRTSEKT